MNDQPDHATSQAPAPTPAASTSVTHEVDPRLLEILVCPLTKTTLRYDAVNAELISKAAGLAYPIRDGIPVMLPDEARTLSDDERDAL